MKEKSFENKVKKFLKDNNCYYVKQFGCAFTRAGVPDLLACIGGYFVAIELKAETGRPSELQLLNIRQIQGANGIAMVLYPKDFDKFKLLCMGLLANPALTDVE